MTNSYTHKLKRPALKSFWLFHKHLNSDIIDHLPNGLIALYLPKDFAMLKKQLLRQTCLVKVELKKTVSKQDRLEQ
jgi:hypothetical protein